MKIVGAEKTYVDGNQLAAFIGGQAESLLIFDINNIALGALVLHFPRQMGLMVRPAYKIYCTLEPSITKHIISHTTDPMVALTYAAQNIERTLNLQHKR